MRRCEQCGEPLEEGDIIIVPIGSRDAYHEDCWYDGGGSKYNVDIYRYHADEEDK